MVPAVVFSFSSSVIDRISFIPTVYSNKTLFICLFLHALIGAINHGAASVLVREVLREVSAWGQ